MLTIIQRNAQGCSKCPRFLLNGDTRRGALISRVVMIKFYLGALAFAAVYEGASVPSTPAIPDNLVGHYVIRTSNIVMTMRITYNETHFALRTGISWGLWRKHIRKAGSYVSPEDA